MQEARWGFADQISDRAVDAEPQKTRSSAIQPRRNKITREGPLRNCEIEIKKKEPTEKIAFVFLPELLEGLLFLF